MSTTTQVVVTCPRCSQEVTLPLDKVEVSVVDVMMTPRGVDVPMSLAADLTAGGRHNCPPPSMEYKIPIDLPQGTAGM